MRLCGLVPTSSKLPHCNTSLWAPLRGASACEAERPSSLGMESPVGPAASPPEVSRYVGFVAQLSAIICSLGQKSEPKCSKSPQSRPSGSKGGGLAQGRNVDMVSCSRCNTRSVSFAVCQVLESSASDNLIMFNSTVETCQRSG